jgi:HAD superfamily hydrolase (TIGR01549 family)
VAALLGRPDWRDHEAEFERRFGGFQPVDLYPDALSTVAHLQTAGYRVAIVANQPAPRTAELRNLGLNPDVMAMSGEIGVHKPDPAFYTRTLELLGGPEANDVTYVGDRLDNDVLPSSAAGMRPVWLKRGPWGALINDAPPAGTLVVSSLTEFVDRIDEVWQ